MAIGTLKIDNYVPVVRQNEGIYTSYDIQTTGALTSTGVLSSTTGVAAVAGGAAVINTGNASGPNIYTGSGAPTVSAPKGSLYLRTDGSTTNDRAYINTNGTTTWTALTTAA